MKIVYNDPNTGVMAVLTSAENSSLTLEEIIKKDVPQDAEYQIIEDNELPIDRTYRNAWKYDSTKGAHVDMPRARIIQLDKIRVARNSELNKKDIELMVANEQKNNIEAAIIKNNKQTLRDLTTTVQPDLDAVTSTDELKKVDGGLILE